MNAYTGTPKRDRKFNIAATIRKRYSPSRSLGSCHRSRAQQIIRFETINGVTNANNHSFHYEQGDVLGIHSVNSFDTLLPYGLTGTLKGTYRGTPVVQIDANTWVHSSGSL